MLYKFFGIFVLLLLISGCGIKGPPLPPLPPEQRTIEEAKEKKRKEHREKEKDLEDQFEEKYSKDLPKE